MLMKKLPSGATIPSIGLGVYKSRKGKETYEAVLSALRIGYRHIDTAQWYRNEADVGKAVQDSGLPRSEIFLTTKLWVSHWGYDKATIAVRECNARLGSTYIDLLLLHAPGDKETRAETWRALEDLQAEGIVRDIGVSNFGIAHLEKLFTTARVRPALNQIELHPWLARKELVQFCEKQDILVEAYSPLAKATMLADPVVTKIAAELQVTPAQVLIMYSLLKGYITIPKSVHVQRQQENWDAATKLLHLLRKEHIARLDALDSQIVTAWDPITTHEV